MNLKKSIVAFLVLILFSLSGCAGVKGEKKKEEPINKSFFAMGTYIELSIFYDNKSEGEKILNEGEKRFKEIENNMSVNINNSEISSLNLKGHGVVTEDTYYVIKTSLKYAKASKGSFDITVQPLVSLWGIGTDKARVPESDEIKKAISYINYNKIKLNDEKREIFLDRGQAVDFGAIAKGYAADELKKIFLKNGVKCGFINLGGNVMTIGSKLDNSDWKVGIQNPFGKRDDQFGIIKISDKSIVTSGNYERYFEKDGVRYHHILDPKTGYPSNSGIVSSTIISEKGIDGDALSTTTFILGVDKALKLIESMNGIDAIFVTSDKRIYVTKGIRDNFEIINEEFKLSN